MAYFEFNFGELILSTFVLDSPNELRSRLNELGGSLILESDETKTNAAILRTRSRDSSWTKYCGILYQGPINPQIAFNFNCSCWIAFDNCVFLITFSKPQPECVAKLKLPATFFSFIVLNNASVVAVHELGAVCLDNKGDEIWRTDLNDILIKYYVEADKVTLCSENGKTVSHKL